MGLQKFVNWLFRFEDLTPPGSDARYLYRWTLFSLFGFFKIYLHKIMASDWARQPHNHPKRFWSIGLKGRYIEEVYEVRPIDINNVASPDMRLEKTVSNIFEAPWFRTFDADHIHRLVIPEGAPPAWTLVFVGRPKKQWGFFEQVTAGRVEFMPYEHFMKRGDF